MAQNNRSSEIDSEYALEYIKIQWSDIHHSRLQEYSIFAMATAVFYALLNLKPCEGKDASTISNIQLYLAVLGLFFAIIGLIISYNHYLIYKEKIGMIRQMEENIGIHYPHRGRRIPVQILIFLLFAGIGSTFLGIAVYFGMPTYFFYSNDINSTQYAAATMFGLCTFFLVIMRIIIPYFKQRIQKKTLYTIPYFIENDEIDRCLNSMGKTPLKLVVDKLYNRPKEGGAPEINETDWKEGKDSKWKYSVDKDTIIKPAFVTPKDIFQFSVANANSAQKWHYHKFVFEIYVSDEPMEIEYQSQDEKGKHNLKMEKGGVLIVPCGLWHSVKLNGTTYVFQATLEKNGGISQDQHTA